MTNAATHTSLCPGCFADKGSAALCPHCGYDESIKRGPLILPHRTLLHHGQYLIGKVLGKPGGFGITYLALDTKLETRVAIKEYLPRDLAGRDAGHATISAHSDEDGEFFRYGLTQFLQEARTLAKFDHANIVRVRNFFEENSTGYLVMDYYDGITLADYLTQQPQGKLPEQTAVSILMPILDGLREVHAKNFLHRDIKPQNIYLTTGNRPILLDFGAARQAMGERSRSLSVVLSEGYAPYEQYHRRGEQGPWTDIYACAAVLYHTLAGEAPPPATERMHKDELDIAKLGVSASLAEALRLGLAADHNKRPQRMTEFQALLLGGGEVTAKEQVEQKPKKADLSVPDKIVTPPTIDPAQSTTSFSHAGLWATALTLTVLIVIGMAVISIEENGTSQSPSSTVPATQTKPAVTVPAVQTMPTVEEATAANERKTVTYEIEEYSGSEKKYDGSPAVMSRLVAIFDGKRLIGQSVTKYGSGDDHVIIAQKDFNGDGVTDALINSVSCGASACHDSYGFTSIADGKIVTAPVANGVIIEEGGRFLVKSITDDATTYWGFDGKKTIKVRRIPHQRLKTIAEIGKKDENANIFDVDENGFLEVDMDMDGQPDKISCKFWWKVGYQFCTLPLPGGASQKIDFNQLSCYRFGALKTQSNGYRDMVCNDRNKDTVIRFNGTDWVVLKPVH